MSAPASWTVRDILGASARYLAAKGIDTSRLDAELMLADVLGCERMELYVQPERVVGEGERARLRELVRRRGEREPAQYVLGRAHFYGLELVVDPRAICPRRETELLVDRAREIADLLDRAREIGGDKSVRALDLGTGSGCIALALAEKLPEGSHVWATDVSADALDLARANAAKLSLADRVTFLEGDLFRALDGAADVRPFDVIAANLPYVPTGELVTLDPEVREHEPRGALDGGPDGLDVIRRAVADAPQYVAPGGWMLLEVGEDQAEEVTALLARAGFETAKPLRDPSGIDRVVQGHL